jgi:hypothetical protein
MTGEAMSPLRRRMIKDMAIRKLAPKTQQGYIRTVKDFAADSSLASTAPVRCIPSIEHLVAGLFQQARAKFRKTGAAGTHRGPISGERGTVSRLIVAPQDGVGSSAKPGNGAHGGLIACTSRPPDWICPSAAS